MAEQGHVKTKLLDRADVPIEIGRRARKLCSASHNRASDVGAPSFPRSRAHEPVALRPDVLQLLLRSLPRTRKQGESPSLCHRRFGRLDAKYGIHEQRSVETKASSNGGTETGDAEI